MKKRFTLIAVAALTRTLGAQHADTLNLSDLQNEAVRNDPRGRSIQLLQQQSSLRLRNIRAEQLPSFAVNGQAQYQSTTFTLPVTLPGVSIPTPKRDTYDAHLDAREQIFDPTRAARQNVERTQLAQSQAQVSTSLYSLRQNVNDAYFNALLFQERAAIESTSIRDLEAQLKVADARVREGAALPGDAAAIQAAIIATREVVRELDANRVAALRILADLTGRPLTENTLLRLPEGVSVNDTSPRITLDAARGRPEYAQFQLTRNLLGAQREAAARRELPRVSAFARAGYGRPGLNPLSREFSTYWITGLQFDWAPFSWGSNARDRQVLSIQSDIVANEQEAFRQGIVRAAETDLATIRRLESARESDDSLISLRELILKEARAKYAESVITSADLVDKQTDLLAAQLVRASHRIELAQARARLETTLGTGAR